MFCGCSADYFGREPNTHVCPVCLGLPGALPVPNKTAVEWCIKIALALNCKISNVSKFDRKNYFYPDLPKGYQISQYDEPFGSNGFLKLKIKGEKLKMIRVRRVHMEEDTGKLIHSGGASLIDFNRSGVPLVEIVTEPDFESAEEVVEYLQKLQQIIRYLDVSNADMEKGEMRLEPNISLTRSVSRVASGKSHEPPDRSHLPNYKVEVKNINSFRFVAKAIEAEIIRQSEILDRGETPKQETRGWDERKATTVPQRSKEEAHDYRYFPEPDIPPIRFSEPQISNIKYQIPELPDKKAVRFVTKYKITDYDAEILVREKSTAEYFEQAVKDGSKHDVNPKQIANYIINKKPNIERTVPAELVKLILATQQTTMASSEEIKKAVEQVLLSNPKAVEDYKAGKTQALDFLIGRTRAFLPLNSDTAGVREIIEQALKRMIK
jgi:aspartyl-tRNA(Asn)/glutamyl-tRNA(Gln) amidotransferase subunit B